MRRSRHRPFAAKARDVVTFQRLGNILDGEGSPTEDDYGNTTSDWADLAKRKAYVREGFGRETVDQGVVHDFSMTTMRCIYDSVIAGVTAADRVLARGQIWAIKGVIQMDTLKKMIEFSLESTGAVYVIAVPDINSLLLESGSDLLLQNGSRLLLNEA